MATLIEPFATATEMSSAFATGDISAMALAEMTLERIARLDPTLISFVCPTPDRALVEACASDARGASSRCRKPRYFS